MKAKFKVLLFFVMFLVTMVSALGQTAPVADDTVAYYPLENLTDTTGNGNDLTNNGATSGVTGIIDDAYSFNGANNYMDTGITSIGETFSVSFWAKFDDVSSYQSIISKWTSSASNRWTFDIGASSGTLRFYVADTVASETSITTGTWYHVVGTYDGTDLVLYVDNISTTTNPVNSYTEDSSKIFLGAYTTNLQHFDGNIDEVAIFNYSLSSDEVSYLYNSGSPGSDQQYPFSSSPSVSNFTVTAKDIYSDESINNFSITIDTQTYFTNTGTITTHILDNNTNTYNIDFFNASNSYGDYFNLSVSSIDPTTGTYQGNLTQAIVNLQALEKITNNSLNGTFKINGTTQSNLSNIPIKAGLYNFSFTNSSYYQKDLLYNVTALFNDTINITDVYSSVLNLTVFNAYTNNPISNFTGWIASNTLSYNATINSDSATQLLYLINGNYSVYVESENYAVNDTSNYGEININESQEALNLSIWTKNSIRIEVREESNNNLITENVSLVLTGNSSENTYSSTTGDFYFENLTDGEYSLKFDGDNFTQRVYTVTVADRSTQELTAYLTRETDTVIFTFQDSLSTSTIEDVSVNMYRQINSTWTVIESKYSDITGRSQFTYTPNVKYKFYASKTGYTSKEWTLDPILFDSYNIQLDKEQVSTIDQTQTLSIDITPTVFKNNEINNLTFYISSTTGSLQLYGVNVTYPGGSNNWSGSNANGGTVTFSLNITGATILDTVNITYYYDTVLGDLVTKNVRYTILNATGTGTYSSNLGEDYGLGDLEKVFIAVLIIIIVAGLGTMIGGGLIGGVLGLLLAGFFSYIGFIPLLALILMVVVGFVLITRRSSE